jgi:hypothetical protein
MVHLERPQKPVADETRGDWGAAVLDVLGLLVTLMGVALLLAVQFGAV